MEDTITITLNHETTNMTIDSTQTDTFSDVKVLLSLAVKLYAEYMDIPEIRSTGILATMLIEAGAGMKGDSHAE